MRVFLAHLRSPSYKDDAENPIPYHGRDPYLEWLTQKLKSTPMKRESLIVLPAGVPGIVDDEEMLSLEPLRKLARTKQINMILGAYQKSKIPRRVYNTSVLLNHRGDHAVYHKMTVLEEEGRLHNVVRGTHPQIFHVRQDEREFKVAPFIDHDILNSSRNGILSLPFEYQQADMIVVQNSYEDPAWQATLANTLNSWHRPVVFSTRAEGTHSKVLHAAGEFQAPVKEGLHFVDVPLPESFEETHVLQH
ncbi:MAG: nitrilase-related carbon-nitrogen hydrolase [Candidatus Woesearchaeota archaeon]